VAASWPLVARAQQQAMLTVGFVWGGAQAPAVHLIALVRQSLAEAGYVEGRNLTIEYRFAEGNYDRLPSMATELARRVALIVCILTPAALAAKAATATIPIVFTRGDDPVKVGLVAIRIPMTRRRTFRRQHATLGYRFSLCVPAKQTILMAPSKL
jgi:ABC transporter substrate binding protein